MSSIVTHDPQRFRDAMASFRAKVALRFATRGTDKFADASFVPDEHGLPLLQPGFVSSCCSLRARYPGGDHTILAGRVDRTEIDEGMLPALYFRRSFHAIPGAPELELEA